MKQKNSDVKCIDVYEGKRALLASWEERRNEDPEYIKALKRKVDIAKTHLKHKGLL